MATTAATSRALLVLCLLAICGPRMWASGAEVEEDAGGAAPPTEGPGAASDVEKGSFELPAPDLEHSDPRLLGALDAALRAFNLDSKRRGQFGLEAVTETRRVPEKGDSVFVVKFRVRETVCLREDNRLWKDCGFKGDDEAARGWCSLLVALASDKPPIDVGLPNCTIKEVVHENAAPRREHCLGCAVPVGPYHPRVVAAVGVALRKFNNQSRVGVVVGAVARGGVPFVLLSVDRASEQVVAGLKYDLEFSVLESNCSYEDLEANPASCGPTNFSLGVIGTCFASVYFVPWLKRVESSVCCNLMEVPLMGSDVPPKWPPGFGPLNDSPDIPPGNDSVEPSLVQAPEMQLRRPPGFGPLRMERIIESPPDPTGVPVENPGDSPSVPTATAHPPCLRPASLVDLWPLKVDHPTEDRPVGKPSHEPSHNHHHHQHHHHPHAGKQPHRHHHHHHHVGHGEWDSKPLVPGGHGKKPRLHDGEGQLGAGGVPVKAPPPVKSPVKPPVKPHVGPGEKSPAPKESGGDGDGGGFSDLDLLAK